VLFSAGGNAAGEWRSHDDPARAFANRSSKIQVAVEEQATRKQEPCMEDIIRRLLVDAIMSRRRAGPAEGGKEEAACCVGRRRYLSSPRKHTNSSAGHDDGH
jgi:hypothetical protein